MSELIERHPVNREFTDRTPRPPAPGGHFTLHFIEQAAPGDQQPDDKPYVVEVRVAGESVGKLSLYEREWEAIWRAIVHATPSFDRQGIQPLRTGKFR